MLVSMLMCHNEDLPQIHVVDQYVHMVYNQVNLLFVVCNIPIGLREDHHHHPKNILNVFCSHLLNTHRIVVHIEYMFYIVLHQFHHLMHHVHRREVNVIQKFQLNNHEHDQMVVLEQSYV